MFINPNTLSRHFTLSELAKSIQVLTFLQANILYGNWTAIPINHSTLPLYGNEYYSSKLKLFTIFFFTSIEVQHQEHWNVQYQLSDTCINIVHALLQIQTCCQTLVTFIIPECEISDAHSSLLILTPNLHQNLPWLEIDELFFREWIKPSLASQAW